MKRNIKFRAKTITNGRWVYGSLISQGNNLFTICYHRFNPSVQADSIGQFTGHLDRNGKEIYEGDIVEIGFYEDGVTTKHKCVVRWNKLNAGFALYPQEEDEGPWNGWLISNCIIIGNIHESHTSKSRHTPNLTNTTKRKGNEPRTARRSMEVAAQGCQGQGEKTIPQS